jgi:hypothetical protein
MDLGTRSRNVFQKSILVLACMAISVFAWGQHKTESKDTAEHASNPSPRSSPGHASAPSHASGPSHANSAGQRGPTGARPGGTTGTSRGRPGSAANRGGNTPGDHGGNMHTNRGENAPGNHIGNMHGNRVGNPESNRGGYTARGRGDMSRRPAPAHTVSLRGGGSASLRPSGQIRSINQNGMRIQHNLHGGRTIVSERNGVRVVARGRGRGYVQRAYVTRGGRSYYSRTYYDHGVYRVGVYRGYSYRGYHYYGYYPRYWYHPAFYGWAFRPWGAPVYWSVGMGGWGWRGAPWFGFYGGYFAPYPVYSSAAFWLTDYLIAANLQAAYAARSAADADAVAGDDQGQLNYGDEAGQTADSGPVTLTPEVKQAIAEEVKAQLAAQQQQASGGSDGQAQAAEPANGQVPPALDPARRTFVVSGDITVMSNGEECELSAGDVITRLTDSPDADQNVTASVSASKKGDCGAGKQVTVSVEDLQDMHNHFQEQLESGMKALAEKQGTAGLPKAPDTDTTASDVPPPTPDTAAAKDLTDQEAAADQTETQVKQETAEAPTEER